MKLAFDRASVRTSDTDGRLHVELTNISKAAVNPYWGHEIPRWQELGLRADRIYNLLRDPEELAAGAATFNNIQVLGRHVPVSASDPKKLDIVGTTGDRAVFEAPYLQNSLAIWDEVAIAAILSGEQGELSASYYYDADMTPGKFEGTAYDGVMRNIRGNHVALVDVGRAGPDVAVADSHLGEHHHMKVSRQAIALRAALVTHLRPRLAADTAIARALSPIVKGVTIANLPAETPRIVKTVTQTFKGKLATDADLGDLAAIIDAIKSDPDDEMGEDDGEMAPEDMSTDAGPDMAACLAFLKGKLSTEDHAKIAEMLGGSAAEDDGIDTGGGNEGPGKALSKEESKAAMDKAIEKVRADVAAEFQAMRVAEDAVRPIIGAIAPQKSAADVYRLAMDAAKVDYKGVDPSAYPAIVKMIPVPGSATPTVARPAMDKATVKRVHDLFPTATKLKAS